MAPHNLPNPPRRPDWFLPDAPGSATHTCRRCGELLFDDDIPDGCEDPDCTENQ